ncbi:Conserved_hypothetical protein [Hexamita inflata]|uniref:Uncharacterized protein n=1 Tax=Hexamita inflata TaxID=28002 RepID=A0AA86P5W3_9EUKA|nr:Conserved hypothetical protein [Hexamita inflata]
MPVSISPIMNLFLRIIESQMYRQISYQKLVSSQHSSVICSNSILVNGNQIDFCEKQEQALTLNQTAVYSYASDRVVFHSLYTQRVKNVNFDLSFNFQPLPSFALFGLSKEIEIQSSSIQVRTAENMAQSALICFQCDLNATSSDFLFVSSGINVSGLMISSQSYFALAGCSVQFRLGGDFVGGLIAFSSVQSITIGNTNISGYVVQSRVVGYLISTLLEPVQIQANEVSVCVGSIEDVGEGGQLASVVGFILESCNICGKSWYFYGLCLESMDFSEIKDEVLVCRPSFVFGGSQCACQEGKILNNTMCVNLLNITSQLVERDVKSQVVEDKANKDITEIKQTLTTFGQSQISLETKVQQLQDLISSLSIKYDNLKASCYTKEEVDLKFKPLYCPIGSSFVGSKLLDDICKCPEHSVVINNICQCPANSFNVNGVCTCPQNSYITEHGCLCDIKTQSIINGVCTCPPGSTMASGACLCPGEMQLIDNKCQCLYGQVLVGEKCVCQVTGAIVLNGFCTCPSETTVSGGKCVCTAQGSLFKDGACTCADISYYYYNGKCQIIEVEEYCEDHCGNPMKLSLLQKLFKNNVKCRYIMKRKMSLIEFYIYQQYMTHNYISLYQYKCSK